MSRVLIIEDNEDNRIIYGTLLRHHGHHVIEAPSAEAGLALALTECPDLVLMDVGLPGMDGWEATRHLKADPATAHLPVIILTAHALAEEEVASFRAGCDAYLSKPVEPRRVVALVEEVLAERRRDPGAAA